MSKKAIREYLIEKMRSYATSSKERKHRILDEVCETTKLSRKYVTNILNGRINFRARTGRGKTYKGVVAATLKAVWREAGCPCAPYLKAEMPRWVDEYSSQVADIKPDVRALLLRMSDSTMSRVLRGEVRVKPGWSKANKRSGRGAANEIKDATPCASGETIRACDVPPGDCQADTFALGGGDPSDNFFWILDVTDRLTQWTELQPTWNRGQHGTCEALSRIDQRLPFPIRAIHTDNGGEILNHHVLAYLGQKESKPFLWRSRPRKSNDNAHVEEKNRSSGRQLFGEMRLDCPELGRELAEICEMWSDFKNFFCPCKMLVGKVKREDGKGYRCRYDQPRTPFQRTLDAHVLTPAEEASLKARRAALTGMGLYNSVRKKLKRIKRIQAEYDQARKNGSSCAQGSVPGAGRVNPKYVPRVSSAEWSRDRKASAAYLATLEAPSYMREAESVKRAVKRMSASKTKH